MKVGYWEILGFWRSLEKSQGKFQLLDGDGGISIWALNWSAPQIAGGDPVGRPAGISVCILSGSSTITQQVNEAIASNPTCASWFFPWPLGVHLILMTTSFQSTFYMAMWQNWSLSVMWSFVRWILLLCGPFKNWCCQEFDAYLPSILLGNLTSIFPSNHSQFVDDAQHKILLIFLRRSF